MKNYAAAFSLLGYVILSWSLFVLNSIPMTVGVWLSVIGLKLFIKPLRSQLALWFLVGLCFLFFTTISRVSPYLSWPIDFYLTALFGFLILKFVLKRDTEKLQWSFAFSKQEIGSIFLINIPSVAVLYWYYQAHPEVAQSWGLPELPLWAMPLAVLGIAAVNGLREEIFYRGLLQGASEGAPTWFVISLQAVLFGSVHFYGSFPQGWVGVAMTALWGAAIAIQYLYFKKISLSWVTHAMADAVMFTIILYSR